MKTTKTKKTTKRSKTEKPETPAKFDPYETDLVESVERGDWQPMPGGTPARSRYVRYATATFRKDRRLNIRLSSKDLEALQKRALAEGLPYQTFIASLLHKYASGRLKEA
jgi:predicted DNA binding CopG/RHH family protein